MHRYFIVAACYDIAFLIETSERVAPFIDNVSLYTVLYSRIHIYTVFIVVHYSDAVLYITIIIVISDIQL